MGAYSTYKRRMKWRDHMCGVLTITWWCQGRLDNSGALNATEGKQSIDTIWDYTGPFQNDMGAYRYLQAAIEVAGPYVWGVYDLLILPPSFPYGGMENPCLTFVTPTLLAGDRSLDRVVRICSTHVCIFPPVLTPYD